MTCKHCTYLKAITEIIKIWRCPIFIRKDNKKLKLTSFLNSSTWPPFGRLTDIQVITHLLTVAESQTGSDETPPDQIRRVVRPLTLTNRFLALPFYLYRDMDNSGSPPRPETIGLRNLLFDIRYSDNCSRTTLLLRLFVLDISSFFRLPLRLLLFENA